MNFFKFFCESNDAFPGNYVAMTCTMPTFPVQLESGTLVPPSKQHITLVYSENTCVPDSKIKAALSDYDFKSLEFVGNGLAAFPDSESPDKCALVLTIESQILQDIHSLLLSLGCKHSFLPFTPHVTIAYGADKAEAEKIVSSNQHITIPIKGHDLTVEKINKSWVDSI